MAAKPAADADTGKFPHQASAREAAVESESGGAPAVPLLRKLRRPPRRSRARHLLCGASFVLVTTLMLLSMTMVPGSNDAAKAQQPASSSSMADVYEGELTPLQRHVAFFDRNKDGVIYPAETYEGFRAIGCGVALSAASAVFVNAGLGPQTKPENQKTPPFKFPIYVKNIHKGKHGSDSGVYDANGRFVPEKFEEIFKKHAHTKPDALTGKELQEMLQANREPKDFKGWCCIPCAKTRMGFSKRTLSGRSMMAVCLKGWSKRGRLKRSLQRRNDKNITNTLVWTNL